MRAALFLASLCACVVQSFRVHMSAQSRGGSRKNQQSQVPRQVHEAGLHSFFAPCLKGLEEPLSAELSSSRIGAVNVQRASRGCEFQGSFETALRALMWCGTLCFWMHNTQLGLNCTVAAHVQVEDGAPRHAQARGKLQHSHSR
jgi:hypothetical protein